MSAPVVNYAVPRHILLEKHSSQGLTEGFRPRTIQIDFRYIGSVTRKGSLGSAGAICTSNAKTTAVGEGATKIEFI